MTVFVTAVVVVEGCGAEGSDGVDVVTFGTVVVGLGSVGVVVTGGSAVVTFGSAVVRTVVTVGRPAVAFAAGRDAASAAPARPAAATKTTSPPRAFTSPQPPRAQIGCALRRIGQNPCVAVMKRDYYEVLGVGQDADEAAIKRAFHDLAREWHPDVADAPSAEARFRELAEAYNVLSRRESRLLYDRYGYRGRGNAGVDEALWESRPANVARGEDVHTELQLRAFEADSGTRRVITFQAANRCVGCMGRGVLGLPDPECEYCLGTGTKRTVAGVESATIFQMDQCPACLREPCPRCDGTGTVLAERRLRLLIPAGVEDGSFLRVGGDGNDAGAGSLPGDLFVRVHVLPPPRDPRAVRYIAFALLVVAVAALVLYVIR